MTMPRLVISAATMTPNALICRPRRCWRSRQALRDCLRGPLLTVAHRRCAYSWTSQHTSVARMQVTRTTLDASVRRGTGWSGSNPATLSALAPRANHQIDRSVSCPSRGYPVIA
jgi:hypothetical protein